MGGCRRWDKGPERGANGGLIRSGLPYYRREKFARSDCSKYKSKHLVGTEKRGREWKQYLEGKKRSGE